VGDFPPTEIPVSLAVRGTPLFLHKDRKLLDGHVPTSREGRSLHLTWPDAPFSPLEESQTLWVTNPSPARARIEWVFEKPAGFGGSAPARVEMRVDGEGRVRVGLAERMEEVSPEGSCFRVDDRIQVWTLH
jgi:hypothetical protein